MIFPESEYHVAFFDSEGFVRKKCKSCGEYFWTQVSDQEVCGEAPCQDYTFIGNPPTSKKYSFREMREEFLSFFEKNGHKRINPYPIVSRWRNDLYFTDASIVDFQPYVTDGIIPPPANPLVISQPCIRFVDIDNVGLTFGRHLTIFEMGGAHAFNYPEKEIYWKDQTIRYHHEFVTKRLGVKSEAVTYKEGVWSGGGNAGPDVEGIIDGFEVSTLVFMFYKVIGDKFVELPIRTVDTGYGMERFTWLTQGTPSCFDAIYPKILDKVTSVAGLSFDEKLLSDYAKYSGIMKLEKVVNIEKLRGEVAKKIGIDVKKLHETMTPVESVYAIVDHTKSLAFMLAEGVVPSNVREGYLTRLVLRRTYRLLRLLQIENELSNIVNLQIDYWSPDYPHLKEMRDEILEALSIEEDKYKRTLSRGAELVKKISSEIKVEGKNEIPLSTLVELYDSHGLPPNLVSEMAMKEGVKVNVPDDFYATIAKRHIRAPPEEVPTIEEELKEKVSGIPATRTIYYENPYQKKFTAKVLRIIDNKYVVLDQTAFYPEGGGQPTDYGYISSKIGKANVTSAHKVGNVIVHVVEENIPKTGETVEGEIDWNRRISLMRHHTATHLVIGALRRVLGQHVWQAGSQVGVDRTRLDVSHYERISPEQLAEIETLANMAVMENMPVDASFMPREKAEALYGFRLYQGGAVPGKEIRVVKDGDWDVEACGGTHIKSTGEVGLIKIVRTDRIQDGVERIFFSAGLSAVKLIQEKDSTLRKVAELHEVPIEKVGKASEDAVTQLREARREIDQLRGELARHEAQQMLAKVKAIGKIKLSAQHMKEVSVDRLIKLGNELISVEPKLVVIFCSTNKTARLVVIAGDEAVKNGVNSGELAGEISKIIGGGGSGKPNFGQGGGNLIDKVPDALVDAEQLLKKMLK
ncbi:MAG TPA: alanine--tRNA ligase [archaeon]|nr:alanine--tRNA ligase [archaeon]